MATNQQIVYEGIKSFLSERRRELFIKLREVATLLVRFIDGSFTPAPPFEPGGNDSFPVWRGHLADSTGVGLYVDGRTEYYLPTKIGIKFQTSRGFAGPIYGSQLLYRAITEGAAKFPKGVWIVLFSSVPYARRINTQGSKIGRGIGFFDKTKEQLLMTILSSIATEKIAAI